MKKNNISFFIKLLMSFGLVNVKQKKTTSDEEIILSGTHNHRIKLGSMLSVMTCLIMTGIACTIIFGGTTSIENQPQNTEKIASHDFAGSSSVEQLMEKYPTPSALRDAIKKGEIYYSEVPEELRKFIEP